MVDVRKINSSLNVFNFLLLIAIVGMLGYMFYENRRGEKKVVFVNENGELKMYVIEDKVFNGYLKDKVVRVISLNPLYLEVLPQNLQVEKDGKWEKEIYNGSAKVRNSSEPYLYLRGKRN
jgi:hypothetical protein